MLEPYIHACPTSRRRTPASTSRKSAQFQAPDAYTTSRKNTRLHAPGMRAPITQERIHAHIQDVCISPLRNAQNSCAGMQAAVTMGLLLFRATVRLFSLVLSPRSGKNGK